MFTRRIIKIKGNQYGSKNIAVSKIRDNLWKSHFQQLPTGTTTTTTFFKIYIMIETKNEQ